MSTEEEMTARRDGTLRLSAAQILRNEVYRRTSLAVLVLLVAAAFGLHARWLFSAESFADAVNQTSEWWMEGLSSTPLSARLLAVAPFLALSLVVAGLLVRHGLPKDRQVVWRFALLGVLLGACLTDLEGARLAVGHFLKSITLKGLNQLPWLFLVPFVAPVLLGYHALVVWRQRPRSWGYFNLGVSNAAFEALQKEGVIRRFMTTYRQLLRVFGGPSTLSMNGLPEAVVQLETTDSRETSPHMRGETDRLRSFVTSFTVPALLLLLVGFGAISLARYPPDWLDPKFAAGLRWGVAGAFVYVFIEFGGRFFRNDLTVGAAVWAIVTLIVGPALAVILAVAWQMDAKDSPWQTGVVLFFAGLAPRRVVSIVETVALQFLKTTNDVATANKLIPLTTLRGVTPEVAVRLREENIADVGSLAYADVIRLVQNVPYDLRQVVDWIDQAQLHLTLPNHVEMLNERGITGAIDLAWYWLRDAVEVTDHGAVFRPKTPPPETFVEFKGSDAVTVYETAAKLFYEEQVVLLWVMYNSFSTTAGGGADLELPSTSAPSGD